MNTNFKDVRAFNLKFDLVVGDQPQHLTARKLKERIEFINEELVEFILASGVSPQGEQIGEQNMAEMADALVDLVYVAMGTAVMMGLPWERLWDDVHRANMAKERGTTDRMRADLIKPQGWVGPKTATILAENGYAIAQATDLASHVDDEIHS